MNNEIFSLFQAGFVDQQPYRTCASRYCTPSGISLDSDIRIESCCHSNLCNTVTRKISLPFRFFLQQQNEFCLVSWATMSKWYRRVSSSRVSTSLSPQTPVVTTDSPSSRTSKPRKDESQLFLVNDIVNANRQPGVETDLDAERSRLAKLQWNASDPDSYGINWERIPYDRAFSTPVASISKLLVLLLPVLLVLLF